MSSKRYQKIKSKIDKSKFYSLDEAIDLIKKNFRASFDEAVEIHIHLNIDPTKNQQQVKGSMILPHGTPKNKKIVVFADKSQIKDAEKAGADLVGGEELINKIKKTKKCDFDIAIATPEIMKSLTQIARILGPKGLMPSPKTDSITTNIKDTINKLKSGKITFHNDNSGNIHLSLAKVSWDKKKIRENIVSFLETVKNAKPVGVKGSFITNITLTTTMGPGIKLII